MHKPEPIFDKEPIDPNGLNALDGPAALAYAKAHGFLLTVQQVAPPETDWLQRMTPEQAFQWSEQADGSYSYKVFRAWSWDEYQVFPSANQPGVYDHDGNVVLSLAQPMTPLSVIVALTSYNKGFEQGHAAGRHAVQAQIRKALGLDLWLEAIEVRIEEAKEDGLTALRQISAMQNGGI